MTDASAAERQHDAADRMAKYAKQNPGRNPDLPKVSGPPFSPKDRFKLAIFTARAWYFDAINQKNPYWEGYYMAKAENMQDLAIQIAMSQGALLSEILPKVELFHGQFAEAPDS